MSEESDWKFDLDDLGDGGGGGNDSDLDFDGGSPDLSTLGISTTLMPFSILGVVAFLQKAAVVSSLTAIGLSGLPLTAVVAAFWLIGLTTVAGIGVIAVLTAYTLLAGIIGRSGITFGFGLLGALYFASAAGVATFVFGNLPIIVGFVLASTLLIYGLMLAAMLLVGIVVISAMAYKL
jgi:hypothetical protein